MKISDAAAASGCHLETIRYYERLGLVPAPTRTGNGYRVYCSAEVDRLRFINRGRELGFSLDEIRSLLSLGGNPAMSCDDVDAIARTHLTDIQRRIAELRLVATELERVIADCAGGERGTCTILGALRTPEISCESCTGMTSKPSIE